MTKVKKAQGTAVLKTVLELFLENDAERLAIVYGMFYVRNEELRKELAKGQLTRENLMHHKFGYDRCIEDLVFIARKMLREKPVLNTAQKNPSLYA